MKDNRPNSSKDQLALHVFAAWLVPGLGHILAGNRRVGAYILALVGGAFGLGVVLSDFEAVSRDLHPIAFWAQLGVGGGTLPLLAVNPAKQRVLLGNDAISRYEDIPRRNDVGVLFCTVAGLLNLLVCCDVVDRAIGSDRSHRAREVATS